MFFGCWTKILHLRRVVDRIFFARFIFKGHLKGLNILANLALFPQWKPFVVFAYIWQLGWKNEVQIILYQLVFKMYFVISSGGRRTDDPWILWWWAAGCGVDTEAIASWPYIWPLMTLIPTCWSCDDMYSEWWRR